MALTRAQPPAGSVNGLTDSEDDTAVAALAAIFRALADPTRLRIVRAIEGEPRCVSDLANLAGVSEPAASQHLRLLRALRVVRGRRAGKQVYYSLEDDHVRELLNVGFGHIAEARPLQEDRCDG